MKVPISWLENYIKLEHDLEEFGDIMTELEFMQDGPIEKVGSDNVIDLEVRQNRPDILSMIGVSREYAAYLDKSISLPEQKDEIQIEWGTPDKNLSVKDKNNVKRFCAVEINKIKVKKSPKWMKDHLEAYGIPSINNVVDITNYVMLEYGIPLHAFDLNKLKKAEGKASLTLRKATPNEEFETWMGTKLKLSSKDTVVADSERPVAIAGIIGGINSGISPSTTRIILESAVYNQAEVRRTSLRHSIRTDSSTRHEKFLNPNMVETAIRRAIYLIEELCSGEVKKIEDFHESKHEQITIDFNLYELSRIGGVNIESDEAINLLTRLGFEVTEQKEAIGLDQNIIVVKVPDWRTDVRLSADIVEEVIRLWGYENIELQALSTNPKDDDTPLSLKLEKIITDILVNLGLDEHITKPLVQFDESQPEQIKLENPLTSDMNALRVSIRDTLKPVAKKYKKSGQISSQIFEVGNVYKQKRVGEYIEERRIESLYTNESFESKVKPDLIAIFTKLGINNIDLVWAQSGNSLIYKYKGKHIADLYSDGYVLYINYLVDFIEINQIPYLEFNTSITQKIVEDLSIIVNKKVKLGEVANTIKASSNFLASVDISDIYKDNKIGMDNVSATFKMLFEDDKKEMTRNSIEETKDEIVKKLKSKFSAKLG